MRRFLRFFAPVSMFALVAGAAHAQAPNTTLPGPFGPPSWDTQYPAKERFLVLTQFNSEAVLDRETGLVWQRSMIGATFTWPYALLSCQEQIIGNRRGWRLPSYEELNSLLDPKHTNPALPPNNPFKNFLPTDIFWSATTAAADTTRAYTMVVANAAVTGVGSKTLTSVRAWCVRGGQGTQNPF